MSQYYLMAQLPSLDCVGDTAPLPITEERFYELCHRFLGKKATGILEALTLAPARDGAAVRSPLVEAFNTYERQLRLALGLARAAKLQKPFDAGDASIPASVQQTANTAVSMDDPLAAEAFLSQLRLEHLESLRPGDAFSEEAVFYYGLKLKLLSRMRQFDESRGQAAYQTIYDSILHQDKQEATE